MSQTAAALSVLQSGDSERAKAMLVQAYNEDPGGAATLLARIALDDGEVERAETLSRTAIENHSSIAVAYLADAVGRQGRRKEAEQLALDAIGGLPDSSLLRAVLGEQRIRQAEWDIGTSDFVDAMTLDDPDAAIRHLARVCRDLTIGHKAGKVPTDRASTFVHRIENGARRSPHLAQLLAATRRALGNKEVLEHEVHVHVSPSPRRDNPPQQHSPPARSLLTQQPKRPQGQPEQHEQLPRQHRMEARAPNAPAVTRANRNAPKLVAVMQRDRALNEQLQAGLEHLGLPEWPSDSPATLDVIEPMAPTLLNIDRAEFQREHLNVTSGSVDAEIIIERAVQSLTSEVSRTTATALSFNDVGLTKLEMALWDNAATRMAAIPDVYLGAQTDVNAAVLAIGGFLGACILRPGDATWSFERVPEQSTIETSSGGDLKPFLLARQWLEANDKDDVHLEEFLGKARLMADLNSTADIVYDATTGLQESALSMKLAELWLNWRASPLDTAQNIVAEAIRPLNVLENIIFFALSSDFAPMMAGGPGKASDFRGEVPMAYVRTSGEFLALGSRKHFARAIGELCGEISAQQVPMIMDMFGTFHRPTAKVVREGPHKPRIEQKGGASMVRFSVLVGQQQQDYALLNAAADAVKWRLLEV